MQGTGITKIVKSVSKLTMEVNSQTGNGLRHQDAVAGSSDASGMHDILRRTCCKIVHTPTKPKAHKQKRCSMGLGKIRRY